LKADAPGSFAKFGAGLRRPEHGRIDSARNIGNFAVISRWRQAAVPRIKMRFAPDALCGDRLNRNDLWGECHIMGAQQFQTGRRIEFRPASHAMFASDSSGSRRAKLSPSCIALS
jgi:hypothetical protein